MFNNGVNNINDLFIFDKLIISLALPTSSSDDLVVAPNLLYTRFGLPYWSLSAYLKRRVKKALAYVDNNEVAVAAETR